MVFIILIGKMAINKSYISTASAQRYGASIVQIITAQPPSSGVLTNPMKPGQLVGYYDGTIDAVRLFVVSGSGTRLLKVV